MLNYSISGNPEGELLVFINGAGLSSWMWYKQLEFFKDFKIITFDLPGHGQNYEHEFTTIRNLASEVAKIIKAEGNRAYLIGHSIGAQTTLEMLRSYPEVINKAIVVSALNKDMKFKKTTLKVVEFSYPLIKSRLFSKLQFDQLKLPKEFFNQYYQFTQTISKNSLVNLTKDNMDFSFNEKTDKEVKLIYGKGEIKAMISSGESLARLFKAKVTYLSGGHGVPYIDKSFNNLVKEFIKGSVKID